MKRLDISAMVPASQAPPKPPWVLHDSPLHNLNREGRLRRQDQERRGGGGGGGELRTVHAKAVRPTFMTNAPFPPSICLTAHARRGRFSGSLRPRQTERRRRRQVATRKRVCSTRQESLPDNGPVSHAARIRQSPPSALSSSSRLRKSGKVTGEKEPITRIGQRRQPAEPGPRTK